MKRLLLLTALLCALAGPLAAQVPVALSPVPHLQFLSNAGIPLASGCVFTYQAGTTTPATTYRDSGGVTTNTNPIILNAGGFADIWLPNAAFKFTVKSAGGVNCASGGALWTMDNISGILGLLNLNNIWTGTNQFNQAIVVNVNTNQIQTGTVGNRTTLNFPAPAGNVTLNFPLTADTMVGRATTDTLTNKTLTAPVLSGAANNSLVCTNGSAALTTSGCATPAAAASNLTAQQANIGATTLLTPGANGFYRFSCYIIITQAATTSSTTPSCAIAWTDADTSATLAATLLQTNTANVAGNVSVEISNTLRNVFAKSGTAITFNTASYASVGATPMQYAIHVRLEGPF